MKSGDLVSCTSTALGLERVVEIKLTEHVRKPARHDTEVSRRKISPRVLQGVPVWTNDVVGWRCDTEACGADNHVDSDFIPC